MRVYCLKDSSVTEQINSRRGKGIISFSYVEGATGFPPKPPIARVKGQAVILPTRSHLLGLHEKVSGDGELAPMSLVHIARFTLFMVMLVLHNRC